MPFGRDLDFAGQFRSSTYRGTLRFGSVFEPYMPDRVLRQFGRVQEPPLAVIPPTFAQRPFRLQRRYIVTLSLQHHRWADQDPERFYPVTGHRRTVESCQRDVSADYLAWFQSQSRGHVLPTTVVLPDAPPAAPTHPDDVIRAAEDEAAARQARVDEMTQSIQALVDHPQLEQMYEHFMGYIRSLQ